MKIFKIIRNCLIFLIIMVSLIYIFIVRNNNIQNSKSYIFFKSLISDNIEKISMNISFKNQDLELLFVYGTDNIEKDELQYLRVEYFLTTNIDEKDAATVTEVSQNKKQVYTIFPKEKKYRILFENNTDKNDDFDEWIDEILYKLESCRYYTKGYKLIDGKMIYYEKFKDIGLTLYYNENSLIYIKSKQIDETMDNIDGVMYNVSITHDDSFRKYVGIPNDYIEQK